MSALDAAAVIIDLLQRGHAVEFRVRGDSMHPVIREDDAVHVEPVREVEAGDVALTLAERGLTAHRVVSVLNGIVVTRGDNATSDDDPLPLERVLGKVTWVERGGRRRGVARRWWHLLRR
ncbi:MAG TPA: S24/S26 family peptidase [Thermoanaerobaculia bacterium]|jgi:phage repressor protein C with HTH and peptisase S24 domain